ncbi:MULTISPECIES: hypothetical protein [unclassified Anaeromyxobacter]|uniref:hypothetical protein n=1 Tax=unclassified Anaeromyxobacter TaxID=2620896 RepID=UPI001F593F2E|nr:MULTISPECIES: hypothetical protein [unclassified Anaeromyxobacter]
MPAPLPVDLLAAADWSVSERKRWLALAQRGADGRWRAGGARPVGRAETLVARLARRAGTRRRALLGLDLPIGVPAAYAARVGADSFLAWAPGLGAPPYEAFFTPAATAAEITLHRPFYPERARRAGVVRQAELCAALGVPGFDALRRACDRARPGRRAAEALFWTVGGKQVGKAALAGWRDVVLPALRDARAAIWPFQGELATLLRPGAVVLAEIYPADAWRRLGAAPVSKRDPASRLAACAALGRWLRAAGVFASRRLSTQLAEGFGRRPDGEDAFDAVVALLGMLDVVLGRTALFEPEQEARAVEGWILGLDPG